MRFTTSFFNPSLHRSDWRRFWPLLFIYAAGWIVSMPLAIWSSSSHREELAERFHVVETHILGCTQASVIVSIIFGVLLAMALFSYLMRANSVGLMHALPITRGAQFCNHFLVGVEMFTAGNVLVTVLSLLAQLSVGAVAMTVTLQWLLVSELTGLFFFALATACAMLTGWVLAVPVIYAGVNFVVLGIVAVLQLMGEEFYFGFEGFSIPAFAIWLTPTVKLFMSMGYDSDYVQGTEVIVNALRPEAIPTVLIYTVVSLVLIALGYVLYRYRRSETAGDAIVFDWLKPVVKYVIALAGGLGLGLFLFEIMYWNGLAVLLACQFLMGGICYLAVEMLLHKTFKIFKKKMWLGLGALFAALLALTLMVRFDLGGYQTHVPKAAQVESVEFGCSGTASYWYNVKDAEAAEKVTVLHQAIVDAYRRGEISNGSYTDNGFAFYFNYTLKGNGTLSRDYTISVPKDSDIHRALNELMNLPSIRSNEIIDSYDPAALEEIRGGYATNWQTNQEIQLTKAQAQAIFAAFTRYIDSDTGYHDVLSDIEQEMAAVRVEFDMETGRYMATDRIPSDCTEVMDLLVEYGLADSGTELIYRESGDTDPDAPVDSIIYD